MPRSKVTTASRSPVRRRPVIGWSLAVVDNDPIRHEACVRYEELHKALHSLEVELTEHHRVDLPAYQHWLNKHFEKEVAELREINRQLNPLKELLQDVDDFVRHGGLSPRQAYREVIKARAQVNRAKEGRGSEDEPDSKERGRAKVDDFIEDLDEAFGTEVGKNGKRHNPDALAVALKHTYREIVRRLHPDHLTEPTPAQQELWHQAQEAYLRRDLVGLEVLLGLCEAGEGGIAKITRISLLRAMAKKVEQRLGVLRFQLAGLRKQASWQFTCCKNFNTLYRRVQGEMVQTVQRTKDDLAKIQERVKDLEAAQSAPRKTKTAGKSRRSAAKKKMAYC